jgi:hypothetical protein
VVCSWCNEPNPETKCKSCDADVHLSPSCSVENLILYPSCSVEHLPILQHCNACLCMVCGVRHVEHALEKCKTCGARVHHPDVHSTPNSYVTCSHAMAPDGEETECGPCRAAYLLKEEPASYQAFVDLHHDTFKVTLNFKSTLPVDYKTIPAAKPRYLHHATFYLMSPPPTSPSSITH